MRTDNKRSTCLIVDDEPDAHKLIEHYCKMVGNIDIVENYYDAISVIQFFEHRTVDFLFLDINLPEISGIELLKLLNQQPLVIFTTAYSEYALQGYEFNVVDYLLKPIRLEHFMRAVRKVSYWQESQLMRLAETVQFDGLASPIKPSDIIYAQAMGNYCKLITTKKTFIIHETMKTLEETLNNYGFIRCHKSYIINKIEIQSINTDFCLLSNSVQLPIGISYRQQIKKIG